MDFEAGQSWSTKYRYYYYMRLCGYAQLVCSLIAISFNVLVILVMSTKHIMSPINKIFTHIAITDSLTLLSYLPHLWHEFFRVDECSIKEHRTYIWEEISLHSYLIAFIFRHASLWLAMILGLWRYIAIAHPFKETFWCTMENTSKLIIAGYIFGLLVTIPPYFSMSVKVTNKLLYQDECKKNETIYGFTIVLEDFPILYKSTFLIYGVFLKILPSVIFAVISYKLISALIGVKKYRMKNTDTASLNSEKKYTERITVILLIILILFMIGEVPHGICCILTAYYGPAFYWEYYYYILEIINSITHFAHCFNFIIYYAMSHQFRETFNTLIQRKTRALRNIKIFSQSSISCSQRNSRSNDGRNQTPSIKVNSFYYTDYI